MFRESLLFLGIVCAAHSAQADPLSLDDITSISQITTHDPLGYACIDAKYLDDREDGSAAVAFTLAGKVRIPRTCLPEPCARALSQRELSNLTGTEMVLPRFKNEWDDYYARYADFCRKEVVPFGGPAPQPVATPENFWPPLLNPPIVTDDLITNLTPPFGQNGPPVRRPGTVYTPIVRTPHLNIPNLPIGPAFDSGRNNCSALVGGNSFWVIDVDNTGRTCRAGGGTAAGSSSNGTGGGGPITPPLPPSVTPVPGPAALGMMLTALAALGALGRRRRRSV